MKPINLTEIEKRTLNKVYKWVEDFFKNISNVGKAHGLDHSQRVAGIAATLAIMEKRKPFLPILAALLFDIGRAIENDPRSHDSRHGQLSVELTKNLLDSLEISNEDKEIIKNAMADHSKKRESVRPNYLVDIIIDASLIENLGAIGVLRAAQNRSNLPLYLKNIETSREDKNIKTIYQDIVYRQEIPLESFNTQSAKDLSHSRRKIRKEFIKQLNDELSSSQNMFDSILS